VVSIFSGASAGDHLLGLLSGRGSSRRGNRSAYVYVGPVWETPASATPSQEGTRDALCTFTEKSGAEETYFARAQGVSVSTDQKAALIWVVRSTSGVPAEPGALQQMFATDSKIQGDQKPPLIGERNAEISLHSMLDRIEGSASATEKLAPVGFLNLELKLRSASG
jgi:hypothetical protein